MNAKRLSQRKVRQKKSIQARPMILSELLESRLLLSSTYTVNSLADVSSSDSVMTLRRAVALASANSTSGQVTVNFASSLFASGPQTIYLVKGAIPISNDVNIQGPGPSTLTIDGSHNSDRAFEILGNSRGIIDRVSINLFSADTLYNTGSQGGAIFNAGTADLVNDTFTNDSVGGSASLADGPTAVADGGAVYSIGNLTASDSVFTKDEALGADASYNANTNVQNPGEPAAGGAVAGAASCTMSLNDVVFTSNSVVGGSNGPGNSLWGPAQGGAVSSLGNLTVSNCQFTTNEVTGGNNTVDGGNQALIAGTAQGGAIYAANAGINDSQFAGNRATGGDCTNGPNGGGGIGGQGAGGDIYTYGKTSIAQTLIQGGDASSGASVPSIHYKVGPGNTAAGGGIYCRGGSLSVVNSCILLSGAAGSNGTTPTGAYGVYGGVGQGGAIWSSVATSITNSTIHSCAATGGEGVGGLPGGQGQGGALYVNSTSTTITNSTFALNDAVGGNGTSSSSANAAGGMAAGGAVYATGPLKVYDSTIATNQTMPGSGKGGLGQSIGAGIYDSVAPLLYNTVVSQNQSGTQSIKVGTVTKTVLIYSDLGGAAAATSSQHNFIGTGSNLTNGVNGNQIGSDNPQLQTPGFYGGTWLTLLPMASSPLINAGGNSLIPSGVKTDERGVPRIWGGTVDIGATEYATYDVNGYVFNDLNGDGKQETNEVGMSGWQVYVDVNNSGALASGDPVATTDSTGHYNLYLPFLPGVHTQIIIREVRQNGWRSTYPTAAYPNNDWTFDQSTVSYTSSVISNYSFGDSTTGLISGTVFHDTNKNGTQDAGEAGLSGWTIEVDQMVNGVWKDNVFSTITDTSGHYAIALKAGTYRVHDLLMSGLKATTPSNGSWTITLATAGSATGENFGND